MSALPTPLLLDRFLSDAAIRGERAVAWLRIWLCVFAFTNLLVFGDGLADLRAGEPRMRVILAILIIGASFGFWMLRRLRSDRAPSWLHDVSAAADALITVGVIGCSVWWTTPAFTGLIRMPHAGVFPMAIATSGFRLRGRSVAASTAIVLPGAVALLLYDLRANPVSADTPASYIGLWAGMMGLGILMALAISQRTRALVHEGARAALDAERTRQRLGVYVSQAFAEEALASELLVPGGERRRVAVLFTDLRGFTRYSEALSPERLVHELNAWLDVMIAEVRAEGGVVDKFVGDAIMVVWGIPRAADDDAARAIRTALSMRAALARHNLDRAAAGLPALRQGIGVHVGDAIAGNIGTADRMQYTVIGDTVNLASRLESATKGLGCDILVSDDAVRAAAAAAPTTLRPAGAITLPGKEAPVEAWRVDATAAPPAPATPRR